MGIVFGAMPRGACDDFKASSFAELSCKVVAFLAPELKSSMASREIGWLPFRATLGLPVSKAKASASEGNDAGFGEFKISVVITRHNIAQLDEFKAIADEFGAQLRITRLRPSGRAVDTWEELHPTLDQQRTLHQWLLGHGENVLTGDSFFHLNALGESLPGLNLCGAGRVVCLIDPIGDVYACPFVIHDEFLAGNVRDDGGFAAVWRTSDCFTELRGPQSAGACASCGSWDACQGGCMAAKFFTGLPLDGPDPECVGGDGEYALASAGAIPRPSGDHSKPVAVQLVRRSNV